MTARTGFDDFLAAWLEDGAAPEPAGLHRRSMTALHDVPQRSSWRARLATATSGAVPVRREASPALVTALVVGLVVVLVGMGLFIGTRPRTLPIPAVVAPPVPTAAVPSVAPAKPIGAWRMTGPMVARHEDPTATLLADGRVLVVGGAAAEIYDPDADRWTAVAPPRVPRIDHVAVALADGDVLIAGGTALDGDAPLASVERYHPGDDTWTEVAPMPDARARGMTASLLPDGTVLVAGGIEFAAVAAADRFDAAAGTWTQAPMIRGRSDHTATLMADGTVLVTGGQIVHESAMVTAERFRPGSGTWSEEPDMGEGRTQHAATLLDDGSLLVVGGTLGSVGEFSASRDIVRSASAERLSLDGSWAPADSLATGRSDAGVARLADGTILVIGGLGSAAPLGSVERYEPARGGWSEAASLLIRRTGPVAVVLLDGTVLAVGGDELALGDGEVTTAERFDPAG